MKRKESKAKTFDILRFIADNAGLSTFEAIEKAYNMGVSEQQPCEYEPFTIAEVSPEMRKLMEEWQQPCEDCIRELIREFDNEHPALFADYMQEFNNHPISEIIDYMWDMHYLIEDIKYRLPNEGGAESEGI